MSVISSPAQGPIRTGERTWATSSDLCPGQSLSGHVSLARAAQDMTASCRRLHPSANRGTRRVSWQTADPPADRPEPCQASVTPQGAPTLSPRALVLRFAVLVPGALPYQATIDWLIDAIPDTAARARESS